MPPRSGGRDRQAASAGRDNRAGRLLAVNLSRPIIAAAAAGAWLPPVAVAGLSVETGHGGVGCAAVAERRCPSSPTRQRYRVRVHQAAVAPSLDAGPVEKKGVDAERAVVPQLVTVDHILFTRFIMPATSDDAAAVMLRIYDDSAVR